MNLVETCKAWRHKRSVFSLLRQGPVPLFSKNLKLVLFLSAKAGFTFSVKWFFAQLGLLQDALAYHYWVHNYRMEIYYKSQEHLSGLRQFCHEPGAYTVVKLTREPYARAVSSYIHTNASVFENKNLGAFLQRDLAARTGERFSFHEYIDWLETRDLRNCNIHHKVQTHAAERASVVNPQHLIDLAEAPEGFKQIEKQLGLQATDVDAFRSSHHHTQRDTGHDGSFCGDSLFDFRFDKHNNRLTVPPVAAFYSEDLRRRVSSLYAEDFKRYNYPVNPANL